MEQPSDAETNSAFNDCQWLIVIAYENQVELRNENL
jgi:hypothetical protein